MSTSANAIKHLAVSMERVLHQAVVISSRKVAYGRLVLLLSKCTLRFFVGVTQVLLLFCSSVSFAQKAGDGPIKESEPAKSFRDRVVDRVTLKDGTHLYGLAVSEKPPKLIVRSAWLDEKQAELFTNEIKPLLAAVDATEPSLLVQRIDQEIESSEKLMPRDPRRIGLLKEIRNRLNPDTNAVPEFVSIEIAKSRFRNFELQKEPRRELCRLAVFNGLTNYEDARWQDVAEELQAIPDGQRRQAAVNASGDAESDEEKILAAVDVQLGVATKLVQSGDQVMAEGQKPDLSVLLNSMLGGNVQTLLNELLNEGAIAPPNANRAADLPVAAKNMAEKAGQKTIVLSSFEFDVNAGTASVTKRLFRQRMNKNWVVALTVTCQSTVGDLKDGQADAIANDPQVKEISGLASSLGIGGDKLQTALQLGAVVQNALNNAENEFGLAVSGVISAKSLSATQRIPELILK